MSLLADFFAPLRPPPGDRHGPLSPMLVTLTLVTGLVDAASYLKLGHVFVANMTGNVVFIGFALAGAGGLSLVASLIALVAFLLGALAGGKLGARHPDHRGHVLRAASFAQGPLVAGALLLALVAPEPFDRASRYGLAALLALAMGVQNAAAQRLAIPDLTTTVLTRTLTGLAAETGLADGGAVKLGRRVIAIAAMLTGALAGALLVLHVSVAASLALALALVSTVGLAVHLASRSNAAWTRP